VLSVGTLQKVAIILALAHEPELLILDEPAASLDPAARRDFLKALVDIAVDGKRTILFSTHITSDLERVADRVAILRGGQIAYDGELDELTDAVKRLHVTAKRPLSPSFNVPGAMRLRVEGNEALVSIHGASDEMLESIRKDYDASVRVEDLNLEDIFLEMHHD
jgi:ABC-2 type transport system ATP-binding protein